MTSWFTPGSIPWLLAYEMRLNWRSYFSGKRRWLGPLAMLVVMAFLSVAGWPMAAHTTAQDLTVDGGSALAALLFCIFIFLVEVSQALALTVRLFFERGDFDLILSSPLPPDRVLFVRSVGLALSVSALFLFVAVPFVVPFAVLVAPSMWLGLIFLLAMGFVAAAVGLWLAMGLIALIGVRRTKTVGIILSAFIGVSLLLGSQLAANVPMVAHWLDGMLHAASAHFSAGVWWTLPLKAIYGNVLVNLVSAVGAGAVFYGTTRIFGRRFMQVTAVAAAADAGVNARAWRRSGLAHFDTSLSRSLLRKEWKLLWRDPTLLSQVLVQLLCLVPITFVIGKNFLKGHTYSAFACAAAGVLVLFACQLADALAWISVSAEEAPELLGAAPVAQDDLFKAKIRACLVMVAMVFVLPVAGLIVYAPWAGIVAAVGIYLTSVSAAYLNLWYQKPAPRKTFMRRGKSDQVKAFGVLALGIAFMVVVTNAAAASLWAFVWALLPTALLGGFYYFRRQDV